jgi:hypothetical protein
VVTLTEATLHGEPVSDIQLLSVRFGSTRHTPAAELESSSFGLNARWPITCTLPCGFGEHPGTWLVLASAPGASPTQVRIEADYSESGGDCPSYSKNGSEIAIELTPVRRPDS